MAKEKYYVKFHQIEEAQELELADGTRIPDPGYYTFGGRPLLLRREDVEYLPKDAFREATTEEIENGIVYGEDAPEGIRRAKSVRFR